MNFFAYLIHITKRTDRRLITNATFKGIYLLCSNNSEEFYSLQYSLTYVVVYYFIAVSCISFLNLTL